VWQLQRREWKLEQLEERRRQLGAPPLPLRSLAAGAAPGEWRRVAGRGELDHTHAAFVRGLLSAPLLRSHLLAGRLARECAPSPAQPAKATCWCAFSHTARLASTQPALAQIEPLLPAEGGPPLLLNRGWVPAEWKACVPKAGCTRTALTALQEAHARQPSPPSCVAFQGVVRASEKPSSFVPANSGDAWFFVDVDALAAAAGLPAGTHLVEVIRHSDGAATASARSYPQPQEEAALLRFSVTPDDHRNYAATWLALAAATGLLGRKAIATRGRSLQRSSSS